MKIFKHVLVVPLIIICLFAFTPQVIMTSASGTIYIRSDGSIDPVTAPIHQEGDTYTFIDDINDVIIIERNNTVLDGDGYTLQGAGSGKGISFSGKEHITIKNLKIQMFEYGIYGTYASYVDIFNSNISSNEYGVFFIFSCSQNSIISNNLTANTYCGIFLSDSSSYNTISRNVMIDNYRSVYLQYSSSNNNITQNTIKSNREGIQLKSHSRFNNVSFNVINESQLYGILLSGYSNNNSILENTVVNNGEGIGLEGYSRFNTIYKNNLIANGIGLQLGYSSNNILRENHVNHSSYSNFGVSGFIYDFDDFIQDIDDSNTADGKPVYYWVNRHDLAVPDDAGWVVLVNCSRIMVENLNLTNNEPGLLLVSTTDSTIRNNTVINGGGIALQQSSYNIITGNNIKENEGHITFIAGIYLRGSMNNTITENIVLKSYCGMYLRTSSNNTVVKNVIDGNDEGINLYDEAHDNYVSQNNVTNNVYGIRIASLCTRNVVSENTVEANNVTGIWLEHLTDENPISNNNVTNNTEYGIHLDEVSNTVLRNNRVKGSKYNFGVSGDATFLDDFVQDIDDSNTADGKPVYYWVNRHDLAVPDDAGWVVLVNCSRITVEHLNLANNKPVLLLVSTTDSTIQENTATIGGSITLQRSSNNNTISRNTVSSNSEYGFMLEYSSNNRIHGNAVTNNGYGIYLFDSPSNHISENTVSFNERDGIWVRSATNNSIHGNVIESNGEQGIHLRASTNNTVSWNSIMTNLYGVFIEPVSDNTFYHNNFIDNVHQIFSHKSNNTWDDGYPSGGNYWSDYEANHPTAEELGSSGIWNLPYVISSAEQDNYPLIAPVGTIVRHFIFYSSSVEIRSNSSISSIYLNVPSKQLGFNVTGVSSTIGFFNITIPFELLGSPYVVSFDEATIFPLQSSNTTHMSLYFSYPHTTHTVKITGTTVIPEFPAIFTSILILTLLSITLLYTKRKRVYRITSFE